MKMARVLLADLKDAEVSGYVPQLFKQAGCQVEVFCGPDSWLLKNKSWDVWHKVNNQNSAEYSAALQTLVQAKFFDWIVLTDDYVTRVMNKSIQESEIFKKIFSMVPIEHRVLLGSKAGLSELCAKYNLQTPGWAVYDGAADLNTLTTHLNFPILLKVNESGGGKGIVLVSNQTELVTAFNNLSVEQRRDLVFQEYIKGENISVEALFKNGQLLGFSSAKVIANTAGEYSISRVREYKNFPGLESELKNIGAKLSFNGFCSMTLMRSEANEQFYLVESDLRPHGWFYLAKFAGVDFSELINHYLNNGHKAPSMPIKQTIIRYFSRDVKWALQNHDWPTLRAWIFNKNWRCFIPLTDQKLFWANIGSILKYCLYFIKPLQPVTRTLKQWYRWACS